MPHPWRYGTLGHIVILGEPIHSQLLKTFGIGTHINRFINLDLLITGFKYVLNKYAIPAANIFLIQVKSRAP